MLPLYNLRWRTGAFCCYCCCCCWVMVVVLLTNPVSCRPGVSSSSSSQRMLLSPELLLQHQRVLLSSSSSSIVCPLNFTALEKFPYVVQQAGDPTMGTTARCLAMYDGLSVVLSEYLKQTSFFLVPPETAPACLQDYDAELTKQLQQQQQQGSSNSNNNSNNSTVNFSEMCGFSASYISRGTDNCQRIQTLQDFVRPLSTSVLAAVNASCSGVLGSGNSRSTLCPACIKAMFSMTAALELQQEANGNGISGNGNGGSTIACYNYTTLYVGAFVQRGGPLDPNAAICLWNIVPWTDQGSANGSQRRRLSTPAFFVVIGVIIVVVLSATAAAVLFLCHRQRDIARQTAYVKQTTQMVGDSMRGDFSMVWYSLEEIKTATHNFATDSFVGSGAYANVYRGVLEDGTEIAVKRFKNCSPTGDADFLREVEALSSVGHKNLVSLRGCCIGTVGYGVQGHQRIIVCDYMENGSLHDFLFCNNGSEEQKKRAAECLDWPTRQKIAIDMARGIDYLHHGAQPQILHRDIKSSNVLLDSFFNARVADFGLARFSPDGITHMTTRAAGTPGYIAPEYALYGQLTERSDVYSFGVVLLELISGRKALVPLLLPSPAGAAANEQSGCSLITDWAWTLVKAGNWMQVLDPRLGINNNNKDNNNNRFSAKNLEDMERFVMVALLCAHPQVACRPPTITSARRILEDGQQVPLLPDRPIPLTLNRQRISEAVGGPSNLIRTPGQGFQSYATISSVGSSYMAR